MARKLFWRRNRSDDQGAGQGADAPEESDADEVAPTDASGTTGIDAFSEPHSMPGDQQDAPQRPLSPDDRLKARSLIAAWRVGATWSPSWHRSWLKDHKTDGDKSDLDDAVEGDNGDGGDTPPRDRTIRASIIRDMLDDPEHTPLTFDEEPFEISNKGALLKDCTITDGPLDLTALRFEKPIWMTNCKFPDPIILVDAKLDRVCFDNSEIHSIDGENAHIDRELSLTKSKIDNSVDLSGAKVEGLLRLDNAKLNESKNGAFALICRAAQFGTSVLLRRDFVANGEVNFGAATIKGRFACDGGKFLNEDGTALSCNGAKIGASVFLRYGFQAIGEVNFIGATVGGAFDCCKASFQHDKRTAINCGGIKIAADVFLREGFESIGEVNFAGATIGGQLACVEGKFRNKSRTALRFQSAVIAADVFLSEGFRIVGGLDFFRARVGGHLTINEAQFDLEKTVLQNLSSFLLGEKRVLADLNSATISGVLFLGLIKWGNTELDLRGANVGALADRGAWRWPPFRTLKRWAWFFGWRPYFPSWPKKGHLSLDGFVYERFADDFSDRAVDTSFEMRRAWLDLRFANWWHRYRRFRPQPHTQCAKVLQAAGHTRDARLIRHDREKLWTWSTETSWFLKPFYSLFNALAGYGFKPFRAFVWALAIWLAAVPFYHAAHESGRMVPDNPLVLERYDVTCRTARIEPTNGDTASDNQDVSKKKDPEIQRRLKEIEAVLENKNSYPSYEEFNAYVYSLDAFVPLMEFGQTSKWRPWGAVSASDLCPETKFSIGIPAFLRPYIEWGWPYARSYVQPVFAYSRPIVDPLISLMTPFLLAIRDGFFTLVDWVVEGGRLQWVYWFQVLFGWVLTTVVVTGLTGLLQRGERD